jgi:hypothetical protein
MAKYRKKPVVVEAMQFDGKNGAAIQEWAAGAVTWTPAVQYLLKIKTIEGTMRAAKDDWVIRGIAGEFYPCKPDIFAATYEAVE